MTLQYTLCPEIGELDDDRLSLRSKRKICLHSGFIRHSVAIWHDR
jgi:hypothetical protein